MQEILFGKSDTFGGKGYFAADGSYPLQKVDM